MRCADCKFAHNFDKYGAQCRRYPPTVVWTFHANQDLNPDFYNVFPYVSPEEWCGEFQLNPQLKTLQGI